MFNTLPPYVTPLKQVIIRQMYTLCKLYQSWKMFYQELVTKDPYQTSTKNMRMRPMEWQGEDG